MNPEIHHIRWTLTGKLSFITGGEYSIRASSISELKNKIFHRILEEHRKIRGGQE